MWSGSGLRVLSILVLLLGLIGGAYLSNDRRSQQRGVASGAVVDTTGMTQVQTATSIAAQMPAQAIYVAAQTAAQQAATNAAAAAAAAAKKAQEAARRARAANAATRSENRTQSNNGPIPVSCGAYDGNRAIGCSLLLAAGFGLDQMPCLDKMWTHESNWRTTAENPSSKSYGIPQALPASKMAVFGSDYRSNPATQIKWGLDYITKRYTTPCGAWTFWQAHSWY
jgi:hypothetical protein